MTAIFTAVTGALVLAFLLGLRGVGAFEQAEAKRSEQINLGAPAESNARFDAEVAILRADGRLALSGSAGTLSMLVFGLLGLSLRERRQRHALTARLEALIRTDGETGTANRRAWDERLAHELSQSRRFGYPVTIAMVEVDHFKAYARREGRDAGDRLLSALAANWVPILRTGDLMGRFSSELFAVLLPGCPSEQAEALLARLCGLIPAKQSISGGVATWHWRESTESLLERTLLALEEAKANGGNRIALSQSAAPNVDRPAHKRMVRIETVEGTSGRASVRDTAHQG